MTLKNFKKPVFQPVFLLKAPIKHYRNRDKPIHDLKNPKNHPKKPKPTQV
jgi:hypothetical protein